MRQNVRGRDAKHSRSSQAARRRHRPLGFEALETRRVFAAGFAEFVDPHPADGNQFGASVIALSTGNVVITSPYDDAGGTDAGAVYLFNGRTGELISTLIGSHPNDHVGSEFVTALTNGNFVIESPDWDSDTTQDIGAATWASGVSGISDVVSAENSLVGSTAGDRVGSRLQGSFSSSTIEPLTNGNYFVGSPQWDNGGVVDVGAVTWGDGTKGISGVVTANNSLVGVTAGDQVGSSVTALANGNFVVKSPYWDNEVAENAGAATFVDGTMGLSGPVTSNNSLVGTVANDQVGAGRLYPLANGNYVVSSQNWHSNTGAATFANGSTGISGPVSEVNSLVGNHVLDGGGQQVVVLPNSNYLVVWPIWDNGQLTSAGAVTFGNGTSGVRGFISADNSLVGGKAFDGVGSGSVVVLTNGNYVVRSLAWNNGTVQGAGAVTFGDGSVGVYGVVSEENSLVGSHPTDQVGLYGVVPLANGNYVVKSPKWDNNGIADVGAVTFGSGTTGIVGTVNLSNSLVGATAGDRVGTEPTNNSNNGVVSLANGNYVVQSPLWDRDGIQDAGAATFGSGTSGVTGLVSDANSLVGTATGDQVGIGTVALANGNYVVVSPVWDNGDVMDVGAATFGNGQTGIFGPVNEANSLVGGAANDRVGEGTSLTAKVGTLPNGNYLVGSPNWDHGSIVDVGAFTLGNGISGITGIVSTDNSLVGTNAYNLTKRSFSGIGGAAQALSNSNYLIFSSFGDDASATNAGAVTFADGSVGITGPIDPTHSVIGSNSNSTVSFYVLDNVNQTFAVSFPTDGGGRVRVGSQLDGFSHRWHLAVQPQDVNNDGQIVADDVLTIINYINSDKPRNVADDATIGGPWGFLDVTGDDVIAADDVITVINYINANPSIAEGEASAAQPQAVSGQLSEADAEHDLLLAMLASDIAEAGLRKRLVT